MPPDRKMASVPLRLSAGTPKGALWVLGLLCLGGVFTANPLLTGGAFATLFAIFALLWRPAEPPALFYAMGYQWLQATILVISADLQGVPLDQLDYQHLSLVAKQQVDVEPATWLTLAGVLVVSIGMRLAAGPPSGTKVLTALTAVTARLSVNRSFVACIVSMFVASALVVNSRLVPGLSQPLLALSHVHWVFVYLLTYTVLTQRRGYGLLSIVFAIEIGVGFLGFFSDFKTVLVVILLAALAVPSALSGKRLGLAIAMVAFMVLFGVVWTAIKVEYRDFLNRGTTDQVILVSRSDQVAELGRLMGDLTTERMQFGARNLVARLSYVYFFSEAMEMVPKYVPHEGGALWGDAIYRTLVPRMFDPSKPIVDDSERTAEYTGLLIIGSERGTSVSLGYMAESYIDFGKLFMMLPLFLWGALVGLVYRTFTRNNHHPLFGYGCVAILVLMGASVLEQSNAKLIASLVMGWAVMYMTHRYGAPILMRKMMLPATRRPQAPPRKAGAP